MTIEFHCPYCQKLLKTADDKAGVRANCPGCGQTVMVPDLARETAQADPSYALEQSAVASRAAADAGPALADEGRAATAPTKVCPMCGETILEAATRCRYCGENLVTRQPEGVPTRIEAGEILSRTWEIYKSNLGLLVGSVLVTGGVGFIATMVSSFVQNALTIAVAGPGAGRPGNNQIGAGIAIVGLMLIFTFINIAISVYLEAGLHLLLLRVARGQSAEVADVFAGGRFFWRYFWGTLLFQLMMGIGFLLLIIPGIILALMFWPLFYIIVDRDTGVIDALSRAREVTQGNYLVVFLLFLAGMGITLLGIFPGCGFGLLFTIPLSLLLWAVTYCAMSGQLPPRRA
jgi:uncharacterized membrane protein/DNA-directed RNA polymerase subunit M/transcription elongation factor TFIIS